MSQKSNESSERQRRAEEYFLAQEAETDTRADPGADAGAPRVGSPAPTAAGAAPRWRSPREVATYAVFAGVVAAVLLGLGQATDFGVVVWLGWVAAAVAASITLLATVAGGVRLGMHHALLDAEERRAAS